MRASIRPGAIHSIGELDWMTEATRTQALDKLSKFTAKIGYPDRWKDYTGLEVRADDLFGMIASGDFPDLSAPTGPRRGAPRASDGLIRLDVDGIATFANPNALSAFSRLGWLLMRPRMRSGRCHRRR